LIDVRHPGEIDAKPISLPDNQILCIPFFNLEQRLGELDPQKKYRLYCGKGIMSRLQAQLMRDKGFEQVAVFIAKT
jgi:tRNA uracil 4-sulfurtransferase